MIGYFRRKWEGLKNKITETKLTLKRQYQRIKNQTHHYLLSKYNAFMNLRPIKIIKKLFQGMFFVSKSTFKALKFTFKHSLRAINLILDGVEIVVIKLPFKITFHSLRFSFKSLVMLLKLIHRNPLSFGGSIAITSMIALFKTPMYMKALHSAADPRVAIFFIECGFLLPALGLSYSYRGMKALRQAYLNNKNVAVPVERIISGNKDTDSPSDVNNNLAEPVVVHPPSYANAVQPELPYNSVFLEAISKGIVVDDGGAENPQIGMPVQLLDAIPSPVIISSSPKASPKKRPRSELSEEAPSRSESTPAKTPEVHKRTRSEAEKDMSDDDNADASDVSSKRSKVA